MEPQHNILLTRGELRGLVDKFGITVAQDSPLSSPSNVASVPLKQPHIAENDWRATLATLAAPDRYVAAATPWPAATKISSYYANAMSADGEMVGCWPEGDNLRISFPWTSSDIAEDANQSLLAQMPIPPDEFSVTLSVAGLTTLMAATDAMRAVALNAMLERRTKLDFQLDRTDLQNQIDAGLSGDDARWSVTLLRVLAPISALPTSSDLTAGLPELAKNQLIAVDGVKWTPSAPMLRIASNWGSMLPAVAHQFVMLDRNGTIESHRHRVAIRGQGPLWIIDYSGLVENNVKVNLRSEYGTVYLKGLTEMISAGRAGTVSGTAKPLDLPA